MPRLISMAKTVDAFERRTKTVTRRDGWTFLVKRDLEADPVYLEAVDRSPRTGKGFRRLGVVRVTCATREPLGKITVQDCAREGLPDLDPEAFIELFCAPGKPDPGKMVTRIEFEHVNA